MTLTNTITITLRVTVISLIIPWVLFFKKHFGLGIIEGKGLLEGQFMF